MKASEIHSIWIRNGVGKSLRKHNYLALELRYIGDHETRTTTELMALSEQAELQNKTVVVPPETCTSCYGDGSAATSDWTYGHRPNWWVCSQCNTVLPCHCHRPDADGNSKGFPTPDENGNCGWCGRELSELAKACLREKEALAVAAERTWERAAVESKVEEQRRIRVLYRNQPLVVRATKADLDLIRKREGLTEE
jgi:hypothetical protein